MMIEEAIVVGMDYKIVNNLSTCKEALSSLSKGYLQELERRESAEKALLATEKCINTQNAWDTVQTARKVVIAHKSLVKEMA